jgi:mono/diheme cytochrome c family protein
MPRTGLLAALLALVAATAAHGQEGGDRQRGLVFASQACSSCHAVRAKEVSPVHDAPSFKSIADTDGMSESAIGVFLRTSHPTMPNLILTQDEIRDVAAYIVSLKISP